MGMPFNPSVLTPDFQLIRINVAWQGGSELFLEANPNRVSFVLSAQLLSDIYFGPFVDISNPGDLFLPRNSAPFKATYAEFGAIIGYPWYFRPDGGGFATGFQVVYQPQR